MTTLSGPGRLARLLPPTRLGRRLSAQSVMFAVGEGTFLTGSAVFFTQVVGLTAAQVGVGFTVAGGVAFVLAVPGGRLADRVGPKRAWGAGALVAAGLYATWPLIGGMTMFLVMMAALAVVESAADAGRGAYTIGVFPREERVRNQAFMRAALNIGFTVGAAMGGIALAFDSDQVIRFVPLLTAAIGVVNAVFILRLPDAEADRMAPAAEQLVAAAEGATDAGRRRSALRNRGFVVMSAANGVLTTNQVLLNIVIPLWLVQETDAPRVLLAWLFGTNTVMAVLLQVAAARGVNSVDASLRASRRSAAFFVLSCLIVLVTHDTIGWVTIALVWLGHVTVTGAELFESAGQWGLMSELSDPERRGEYQGAARLGSILGSVWAPAAYTYLAIEWGTVGWLLIAAGVVVATVVMHPAARSAERYLAAEQHVGAA